MADFEGAGHKKWDSPVRLIFNPATYLRPLPYHGILRKFWESMGTERKTTERKEISIAGA